MIVTQTPSLNSSPTHSQALEESLAEAYQLGVESDWQREVVERLQRVDAEQEGMRERLAEVQRQTLAEKKKLADTMRDVSGKKVRAARRVCDQCCCRTNCFYKVYQKSKCHRFKNENDQK